VRYQVGRCVGGSSNPSRVGTLFCATHMTVSSLTSPSALRQSDQ
jgi:hypothetical protein